MNNINSKEELYLELALFINQKIYESNLISYTLFKNVENTLISKRG